MSDAEKKLRRLLKENPEIRERLNENELQLWKMAKDVDTDV